ncbi:hypothetical protein GGX14DRAFT_571304 [Mycena pura]|uniref:Uncharacterized protein n=1 Tax=Mycena pura TaxID=153505 RepID=A0AAD6V768_9AGAR|nr:hypothetical protein GGX14DRAFT_571304 [Mycena pura]
MPTVHVVAAASALRLDVGRPALLLPCSTQCTLPCTGTFSTPHAAPTFHLPAHVPERAQTPSRCPALRDNDSALHAHTRSGRPASCTVPVRYFFYLN